MRDLIAGLRILLVEQYPPFSVEIRLNLACRFHIQMFPTLSNKILFCYAGLGLAISYETEGRGDLQSSNTGAKTLIQTERQGQGQGHDSGGLAWVGDMIGFDEV